MTPPVLHGTVPNWSKNSTCDLKVASDWERNWKTTRRVQICSVSEGLPIIWCNALKQLGINALKTRGSYGQYGLYRNKPAIQNIEYFVQNYFCGDVSFYESTLDAKRCTLLTLPHNEVDSKDHFSPHSFCTEKQGGMFINKLRGSRSFNKYVVWYSCKVIIGIGLCDDLW